MIDYTIDWGLKLQLDLTAIGVGTPDLSANPPKFDITFNISMDDKVLAGSVDLENGTVMNVTESPATKLG